METNFFLFLSYVSSNWTGNSWKVEIPLQQEGRLIYQLYMEPNDCSIRIKLQAVYCSPGRGIIHHNKVREAQQGLEAYQKR